MWLIYADESGSRGFTGSQTYVVAGILLEARRWLAVSEQLICHRRWLRDEFRIPVRAELKANHLITNGGIFRDLGLGDTVRFRIYRGMLRLQAKLELKTYAVVIDKAAMQKRGRQEDPRDVAWEYFLQRVERFTSGAQEPALLFHDEGDTAAIRGLLRRARRIGTAGSAFGTGSLQRPIKLVVDDPVPRQSDQSHLIQLADLNAYAAFRCAVPPPALASGRKHVVPQGMWCELGTAMMGDANKLSGGPAPGVVLWPKKHETPG